MSSDASYRTSLESLWIYNTKTNVFLEKTSTVLWRSRHGSDKSPITNPFHQSKEMGLAI